MAFKFENLQVWQKSLDLTVEVSVLALSFPKFELFSLSSQIRSAADSIVLNIGEGCTGQSNAEFKKFLRYSLRSAIEVVSCLFIARRKGYIDDIKFKIYYNEFEVLCKRLNSLISRIG
jgi:four helix bundle protein